MNEKENIMHIKEFQKLMHDLYYEKDSKRGMPGTFMWLIEEMGELSRALRALNRKNSIENIDEIGEEFADIFAWLCSLANIIGLDLQEHTMKKYDFKCPRCKEKPCKCEFI